MMERKLFAAGVLLLCLCQTASAGDARFSKQYSDCMDRSQGVTVNMHDCIAAETKRQDDRLNRAYKKLMAQLTPERKKRLKAAQLAWIKFRDENCSFYADPDGGTMAGLAAGDCYLSATASRAKELEDMMQ